MFILRGPILETSGVTERARDGSAAGMGIAELLVGVLLAASSGVVGASVALLTLPRMAEADYDAATASGLAANSGTVAILMPPPVMPIVPGDQITATVPQMFGGAVLPGLLLVALSGAWRARGLPARAGEGSGLMRGMARTLLDVAPLVVAALGSIFAGIATPTKSSGMGAVGAALVAAVHGRFSGAAPWSAAKGTAVATSMVFLVIVGATCFRAVFRGVGATTWSRAPSARWAAGRGRGRWESARSSRRAS